MGFAGALLLSIVTGARGEEPGQEVRGVVRLTGPVPAVKYYAVDRDRAACGGERRPVQPLRLGPGQTVADAIVYFGEGPAPGGDRPAAAMLEMQRCDLRPRVQVMRSDAPLVIRNRDPLLHVLRIGVVGADGAVQTVMRLAAPYDGYRKRLDLQAYRQVSLLRISGENGHGWMTAYVAVLPHSLGAVTDGAGRFKIAGVPPGRHRLFAWHERLGTLAQSVEVPRERGVEVTLEFSASR